MKKSVFLLFCLLGLVAIAGPASAATANFQANCAQGIPTDCVFDPNRVSFAEGHQRLVRDPPSRGTSGTLGMALRLS